MNQAHLDAIAALQQMPVELVTTAELALYLRCNKSTIEKMVHKGILRPYTAGRCWRFDKQEAIAALRRAPNGDTAR